MTWARPSSPFATGGGLGTAEPTRPAPSTSPSPAAPGPAGPPPRRPTARVVAAVVAVLVLAGAAVAAYLVTRPSSPGAKRAAAPTTTTQLTAAGVYRRILPSFVIVQATNPGGGELGLGVVVNRSGQVVTALHVVNGATAIRLTFADGSTTDATVASTTPESDLATLAPTQRPGAVVPAVLRLGGLRVGQPVYALGNPLGLTASFTAGVVSGLDRTIPLADGPGQMQHVIQFDAAVDPGSSGGPLVNDRGQVVGWVTGLANPTNQNLFAGIGFATQFPAGGPCDPAAGKCPPPG